MNYQFVEDNIMKQREFVFFSDSKRKIDEKINSKKTSLTCE